MVTAGGQDRALQGKAARQTGNATRANPLQAGSCSERWPGRIGWSRAAWWDPGWGCPFPDLRRPDFSMRGARGTPTPSFAWISRRCPLAGPEARSPPPRPDLIGTGRPCFFRTLEVRSLCSDRRPSVCRRGWQASEDFLREASISLASFATTSDAYLCKPRRVVTPAALFSL